MDSFKQIYDIIVSVCENGCTDFESTIQYFQRHYQESFNLYDVHVVASAVDFAAVRLLVKKGYESMILNELKAALLAARKEKNEIARSVLSTLVGDIETKMKGNPKFSDTDVVALCKKMIENNLATITLGANVEVLQQENSILGEFLPKQLTEAEIRAIIETSLEGMKLPEIMKFFKENHAGCYDSKRLSEIAKGMV